MPKVVVAVWSVLGVLVTSYVVFAAFTYSAEESQVLGVVGSGASVLGIMFTLYQVSETKRLAREAKNASDAANEASEAATREIKASYYRYSLLEAKSLSENRPCGAGVPPARQFSDRL